MSPRPVCGSLAPDSTEKASHDLQSPLHFSDAGKIKGLAISKFDQYRKASKTRVPANDLYDSESMWADRLTAFSMVTFPVRYWSSLLIGEIDFCTWELFCTKFNSEQLLFEDFFDVLHIFGITEPQSESNFPFLYIIEF